MDIAFAPLELASWSDLEAELLAVSIWRDVRPLRGAAGLLDWRLCGRLSRWLREGRVTGEAGEKTLLRSGRIEIPAVVIMGLGDAGGFDHDRARDAVEQVFATMRGLGLGSLAIAPPGRDLDKLSADRAADLLLEVARSQSVDAPRLTLLDSASALRPLATRLGLANPARREQTPAP